jgi:hypothetical protein
LCLNAIKNTILATTNHKDLNLVRTKAFDLVLLQASPRVRAKVAPPLPRSNPTIYIFQKFILKQREKDERERHRGTEAERQGREGRGTERHRGREKGEREGGRKGGREGA